MLKLLSEFLRGPGDFFQDERRQRILIISVFSLLFVCVLFSMTKSVARQRNAARGLDISPASMTPAATQTKWWIRNDPSETPTRLVRSKQTPISGAETPAVVGKCPTYASDFRPGTFGYISLFPPYENLIRSGAGKNYSSVGFIEIGSWVRILTEPVCANDGYVWLNVESAAGSSNWTAGGYKAAQWVIPCPDPNQKCSNHNPVKSFSANPAPNNNDNRISGGSNSTACTSYKLAIGLDAQVSPNDLLIVRSEPLTGSVLGRIAPLAVISIIDGPKCAGNAIWWKVSGQQTGWSIENNLRACPKERQCDAWKDEQLQP